MRASVKWSDKKPSEKFIEMLFVSQTLSVFPGKFEFFAPSTVEEKLLGYDSAFTDKIGREIFLQFKSPRSTQNGGFTVPIYPEQHDKILNEYDPDCAFYISHIFGKLGELGQLKSRSTSASDFLSYYIAVEAHAIGDDPTNFRFSWRKSAGLDPSPKYKKRADSYYRAMHTIPDSKWMSGANLLVKFVSKEIGCTPRARGHSRLHEEIFSNFLPAAGAGSYVLRLQV